LALDPTEGAVVIDDVQFAMWIGTGAMKSLSSAVNEGDERLLTNTLPKFSQEFAAIMPAAVRSTPASPNKPVVRLPAASVVQPDGFGAIGSQILAVLTAPSAAPIALRSRWSAQQPADVGGLLVL